MKTKWLKRLHANYASFSEFSHFALTYGLHQKLGYENPLDAWTANPLVQGSVEPGDYRAVSHPQPKLTVIFRRWPNGNIIALLPQLPGTNNAATCMSYERIGQHASCTPKSVVRGTKPAKSSDSKALFTELTLAGYRLTPAKRLTMAQTKMRLAQL